jgi:hypothetical protein
MSENGDTLIALLRSHEAVGGLLLVVARSESELEHGPDCSCSVQCEAANARGRS